MRSAAQLNLQDDPTFEPDLDLLPMDVDNLDTNFRMEDETQSVLSPHNSQLTSGSQQSIGGLNIPADSSILGGSVDGFDNFGSHVGSGRLARMEPPQQLDDDDLGLLIEPAGALVSGGDTRGSYGRVDRPTSDMSGGLGGSLPGSAMTVCCPTHSLPDIPHIDVG